MGNIENISKDYRLHKKSRNEKHASYPIRFYVPDDKVSWEIEFPEYCPVTFNAPIVLNPDTPWADTQDIRKLKRNFTSFEGVVKLSQNGIPLNPFGRTGIDGRGVLGKWGANFAVDGLITTLHPITNCFQVLTISRTDTGETAFPGGMVDPGENAMETRNRELAEELSINPSDLTDPLYEKIVCKGYVDDPRNTDNAWTETTVIHTHLSYQVATTMALHAADDAKDFQWIEVSGKNIGNFYANHGLSLLIALKEMVNSGASFVDENARSLFLKIT